MIFDSEIARKNMVRQQIRCWDVTNPRVLEVMHSVPREHFVSAKFSALAFVDAELPLDASSEQMMLTPQLQGRILQVLDPQPENTVLEVGTRSGYLTACLARLARHVTSIDASAERIDAANERLDSLGIVNCDLRVQDVYRRSEPHAFDVIAVTASIAAYDPRFEQWLNPGGRAFVVIGAAPAMEACLITRDTNGETEVQSLFETVISPLRIPGETRNPPFRF
ncbi:MAG: protein-L-isoaspartate O-methyltransferase [Gammaproteobacteria bacterium]|nr:protein-L-isoaspartate O-methyltransferase [Gammaproteobacteria bacterium]MBT8444571.1 protein-L-isoaspartate O-methyltransferase [Gammaproteobacteria bacterium]